MTGMQRAGLEALTVVAALLAFACGGNDGPVGSPGSIQVAVSPPALTLPRGGSGSTTGNTFSILATSAFLTAPGAPFGYDLITPDVASLAGFPVASRLPSGVNQASVSGFGFTGPGIFELEPTLGGEAKAATRVVSVVVP